MISYLLFLELEIPTLSNVYLNGCETKLFFFLPEQNSLKFVKKLNKITERQFFLYENYLQMHLCDLIDFQKCENFYCTNSSMCLWATWSLHLSQSKLPKPIGLSFEVCDCEIRITSIHKIIWGNNENHKSSSWDQFSIETRMRYGWTRHFSDIH